MLSGIEVMAQSVASMTPTAAIAITPLLVFFSAGDGTWLAFVIAVALMGTVAYCASHFARRTNSSASLYAWAAQSLGPWAAYSTGWALALGYLFLGSVTILAFEIYGTAFLAGYGLSSTNPLTHASLYAVGFCGPLLLAVRGIRLSARAALVLEGTSVVIIAVLCIATFVHQGSPFDHLQLSLSGVHMSGLAMGVVLAVFATVGFESAASLGHEARHANRHVTRAILGSCVAVGLFYVVVAYSSVFGFEHVKGGLGAQAAPLPALSGVVGLGWLGHAVALGIAASTFGGTIACMNAGARMLYTFGREGFAPSILARAGRVTRTPVAAICAVAIPMIAVPVAWDVAGSTPVTLTQDMGTVATFGFMLAYVVVCIGAVKMRTGGVARRTRVAVAGLIGALGMVCVFCVNWIPQLVSNGVFPALTWPLWALPYVFVGWMLAGAAWFAVVRARRDAGRVAAAVDDAAVRGSS